MTQRKRKSPPYGILQFWYYVLIGCALFVLCFVFIEKAKAEEGKYLYLGAWSYHLNDPDRDLKNETHYLFAYKQDKVLGGVFKNSYNDWTVFVGREIFSREFGDISFKLYGGGTYGYWRCYGGREIGDSSRDLCGLLLPEFTYTKYKIQPSLAALGNAATITFRRKF